MSDDAYPPSLETNPDLADRVYDGFFHWRCYIETKTTRKGIRKWRWVLQRGFAHRWSHVRHGRWKRARGEAIAGGQLALRSRDPDWGREEHVEGYL